MLLLGLLVTTRCRTCRKPQPPLSTPDSGSQYSLLIIIELRNSPLSIVYRYPPVKLDSVLYRFISNAISKSKLSKAKQRVCVLGRCLHARKNWSNQNLLHDMGGGVLNRADSSCVKFINKGRLEVCTY